MILPENLCNRLPGFRALVIWEETTSPLPVGFPTDGLPQLTRKYRVVIALGYHLTLLQSSAGGPTLPESFFCLGVSYQAYVDTPLP